jgi:DNA-binding LacI/PurR family transcriptional regulator
MEQPKEYAIKLTARQLRTLKIEIIGSIMNDYAIPENPHDKRHEALQELIDAVDTQAKEQGFGTPTEPISKAS